MSVLAILSDCISLDFIQCSGLTFMNETVSGAVEGQAKDMILQFLRVYSKKFFIKVKIKQFFEKCNVNFYQLIVMSIQLRMQHYIKNLKFRIEILRKYWDQELSSLIMNLVKVKQKTKKQKELLDKLRSIKESVRDAILEKYFDKCKH